MTIFAAALLVRLAFCFLVYPHLAAELGPGDGYDEIAHNLVRGLGYTMAQGDAAAERLPLYPLLLVPFFAVFGTAAWPWQLAQAAAGALTCTLVYMTARRVTSHTGALAAATVCVFHPALILYTARPFTETLYVLLVVLLVGHVAQPQWRARPVGLLLGLQLLVKSVAWLHVLALLPGLRKHGGRVFRTLVYVGLTLAPWVGWNLGSLGTPNVMTARGGITLFHGTYISRHVGWTHATGDLNLDAELALRAELAARGVGPAAGSHERDAVAGELALSWIREHPGTALRLWLRNLVLTWYLGRSRLSMAVYVVLHGALLIAATVGARTLWGSGAAARQLVVVAVLMIGAYTAFHAVVQPAVRYILPAVPCAALLAAGAFERRRRRIDL